jgi:uncharacterized Tic20 family protein
MSIAMPHVAPQAGPDDPNRADRLRQDGLPSFDRNYALWTHLSPMLAFLVVGPLAIIAPLILWIARRDISAFIDDHGREAMNMSITGLIASFVLVWIPVLGWLALLVWYVVIAIAIIRASIAASNGEFFRYPMTIRFLS